MGEKRKNLSYKFLRSYCILVTLLRLSLYVYALLYFAPPALLCGTGMGQSPLSESTCRTDPSYHLVLAALCTLVPRGLLHILLFHAVK